MRPVLVRYGLRPCIFEDNRNESIRQELRRHSVAIISLLVAASSFAYGAWRGELTEHNENVRDAAFQVLLHVGELQKVVFLSHYDRDNERGNPRDGWAYVLTINDLAQLEPDPLATSARDLKTAWAKSWQGLGTEEAAVEHINAA